MSSATGTSSTMTAAFRTKANQMKSWKPQSTPSNRDRLELYALHKQAVSGDAPVNVPVGANSVSDKAKYQAWRGKQGISQDEAMARYIEECDRQIRVYGNIPQNPTSSNTGGTSSGPVSGTHMPRGLAAIPLLCAAAAESRTAYLRRMANLTPRTAWWSRQESLCATPGTIWSFPETCIITAASLVETGSLMCGDVIPIVPVTVLRSLLWPIHNCFLSIWMAFILVFTALGSGFLSLQTILFGARRTGISLEQIWVEEIRPTVNAANSLCEAHQPMSTRLVGLALIPFGILVGLTEIVLSFTGVLFGSLSYTAIYCMFTWYWFFVMPWMAVCLLWAAGISGIFFALIEGAKV